MSQIYMTTSEPDVPTPPQVKGSTCSRASIAIALVALATQAWAAVELELGDVAGRGWSASVVRAVVDYPRDSGIEFDISADTIDLLIGPLRLEQFVMHCSGRRLGGADWRCDKGTIKFELHGKPVQTSYQLVHAENGYRLELPRLELDSLTMRVNAHIDDGSWNVNLRVDTDDLSKVGHLSLLLDRVGLDLVEGSLGLEIALNAKGSEVSGDGQLEVQGLAFSDESGLRAGEGLGFGVQVSFSQRQTDWQFDSRLRLNHGEMLVDNFYLPDSSEPREISATGVWSHPSAQLKLAHFEVHHPEVLALSGSMDVSFDDKPVINAFTVELPPTAVAPLYQHYVQSLVQGSAFDSVEVDGELAVNIRWEQSQDDRVDITMNEIDLEDKSGDFAIYGLNGDVSWNAKGKAPPTRLQWSGGSVYTVNIGAGSLGGEFFANRFRVTEPVSIPVLDGVLRVSQFEVEDFSASPVWRMSGGLTPISMETLCHALGWPSLSGTLAGSVPGVRYEKGEITTNGAMVMRVFEGEVLIRDLRLSGVFSAVPELRANVDVWNMDLEELTRAFSFGNIEGKLDGRVHELVLQNWEPVAFDASFATPEKDNSRHRISQNAVDSLAQVGGGSGALSATFLSFLEDFPYDRLGLSCRLRNGVCEMGGVEAAERGYYIVKGAWFPPRIDVLGFNDRVVWSELVERLQNIANSQAPIIE